MKISNETLVILKNFAQINTGLLIKPGSVLKTVDTSKSILATATVKDDFPVEFGIYDLNEFLSVLSMHKDVAELEFNASNVVFSGFNGKSKITYRGANKNMLFLPPDKNIKFPDIDVSFELTEDVLNWVFNATKILKLPNIGFRSDGQKLFIVVFDAKDDSKHTDSIEILETGDGITYNMFYDAEIFNKLILGSYDVKFSKVGISSLQNKTIDLHYIMMFHKDSKFNV